MFHWKDQYSVRIPLIDAQHKELFTIGNRIVALLDTDDRTAAEESLDQLMKELSDYTKYHFAQEEMIMRRYDYPDMGLHMKEHQTFIDYLDKIDYDRIDLADQETLVELLQFIEKWISKHVTETDAAYSKFLVEKMGREV